MKFRRAERAETIALSPCADTASDVRKKEVVCPVRWKPILIICIFILLRLFPHVGTGNSSHSFGYGAADPKVVGGNSVRHHRIWQPTAAHHRYLHQRCHLCKASYNGDMFGPLICRISWKFLRKSSYVPHLFFFLGWEKLDVQQRQKSPALYTDDITSSQPYHCWWSTFWAPLASYLFN